MQEKKQADLIREFVLTAIIERARRRGDTQVTIEASQVANGMALGRRRYPNIPPSA